MKVKLATELADALALKLKPAQKNRVRTFIQKLIAGLRRTLDHKTATQLAALVARTAHDVQKADLDEAKEILGPAALVPWVAAHRPGKSLNYAEAHLWLQRAGASDIAGAALRVAALGAIAEDDDSLGKSFDLLVKEERAMAVRFNFDPRGLPTSPVNLKNDVAKRDAYEAAVRSTLDATILGVGGSAKPENANLVAVIIGTLLLKEVFDPASAAFMPTINESWLLALQDSPVLDPKQPRKKRDLYDEVAKNIGLLPGHTAPAAAIVAAGGGPAAAPDTVITFQELASVAKFCAENANLVPSDSPYFANQVRIGLDKYVSGEQPELTLNLPSLTGTTGTDSGINELGVRAVGAIAATYHLERANVIRVVDRITELYMQGLIPLNYDTAARALEDYYWNSEDRLHEGARNMVYGRVLGVANAEASREVVPNREREGYLRSFIAALAEQDRQQTVADLLNGSGPRAASLTVEQVRKSGRDLLANASLYGWGGTQSVARRMTNHMQVAINILQMPSLQQIYGVSSAYQVIERVSQAEFNVVPNMLKEKTQAEAEQKIYDTLAKNIPAFLDANGKPLFDIRVGNAVITPGMVSSDDENVLKTSAQAWLAAAGIADAQVEKLSQPSDTAYFGSLPTFGGAGAKPAANTDVVDRLRQMVSSGTAPSIDQLQQLLPAMRQA